MNKMTETNAPEIDLVALAKEAMQKRGFLTDFSREAQEELKTIEINYKPISEFNLKEMRDKWWFSIDNDDSKDLDQITYAEKLPTGLYKIYIAIADVSATVKKGSFIDFHASYNTTSVYTPAIIFPMLPEKLSTDLTSLNENRDRQAFVTELTIDETGVIKDYQIYKALVKNKAQLAYNSVGAWLETGNNPPEAIARNKELESQLRLHDQISQKMKTYRQSQGFLTLETIETKAILHNRLVVDIIEEKSNRAKDIIENFMVATNTCATTFLHGKNFPSFKRVVRVPKRWDKIIEIASKLGFSLPVEPDSKPLEQFLIQQKEKNPTQYPDLSLSIIKLLGRGEYVVEYPGDEPLGHFGLSLKNYSHSTAPNRRLPDLITQRLIFAVMQGEPIPYTRKELERLAEHCSLKEADADRVARESKKSAAAILLSGKINETFKGIVTGASPEGTWVRILVPPVEGKLMTGGKHVDVGDLVQVKLISVDITKGFIDFSLQ